MGRLLTLNMTAILGGVMAVAAVIWYAGPLLALAGWYPFESPIVRGIGVAFWGAIALGWSIYYLVGRLKQVRALSSGITGGSGGSGATAAADDPGDKDVLDDRMKDALATLKTSSSGKGDYLYDLPWYVIIGPPGSGKTTALVNSGLNFPLARGQSPAAIAGVGGTRYCDWWFTEDAVLIDTAGRYTTQDSNAQADHKSWSSFLDLLKKNRPRQPINGVIVAISIQDIITLEQAEVEAHANAVRARLAELHDRLKIDFPVYVIFTKMDLVAGFIEYFGHYGEFQRRSVWGCTFEPATRKTENLVAKAPAEIDALAERLTDHLPDRLQEEPYPAARLRSFGFPAQFATLKQPIYDFLSRIFEPTRYQSNATLRGFYFASGTQQGTPIDRIIGTLAKSFGAENLGEGLMSGAGKSYFLADLISKVIIGEAAWVTTDRKAVRRQLFLKIAVYSLLGLVSIASVAAWTWSYGRNDRLIADTRHVVADYRTQGGPLLTQEVIDERRFERVLPLLEQIRRMPVGYEFRDADTPIGETFGLAQRPRLTAAGVTSYRAALERFLRPRLLFRLEEVIDKARAESVRSDRSNLYEAFKVYLMLGRQGPMEKGFVVDWFRQDWARDLYPGPEKDGMRKALEEHLSSLLDLDSGTGLIVPLNGPMVADVQQILVRMNVAERAYQILRTKARSGKLRDWQLGRVGTDMATVFDTTDGKGVDSVVIPAFYTYEGFYQGLIDRLPSIADQLERDRWVLGEAGKQNVVANQFDSLADDILAMYSKDFITTWDQALARLKIKPLTTDRPRFLTLAAISAASSPLKQIFDEVKTQTQLSRERKAPEQKDAAGNPIPAKPAVVFQGSASAGKAIEDHFKPYYLMVDGAPGSRPVDQLVGTMNDIYQGLVGAATESGASGQISAATRTSIGTMRASANRFPGPFDKLLRSSSDEFEGNVATSIVSDLQKALAENVTGVCRTAITGRYPFVKGSDKEVPLADFSKIFAPGGVMDKFFTQNLAPFVDTSKPDWVWRRDNKVGSMLSQPTLREFQRAQMIKDAFFSGGGTQAGFAVAVQPMTVTPTGTTVKLDINGTQIASPQVPPVPVFGTAPVGPPPVVPPTPVQWPGPIGLGRVTMTAISDGTGTSFPLLEKGGSWALFRVLDGARVSKKGAGVQVGISASGREFVYDMNVNSLVNPLTMPALREFNCPATLQ
ncbi:type VI secretion system membrane subunit TssM [Siculibacillus lacustris]|uniref:Type VI secretion system membrane subunit TssM n=1 Tax=Siculibacillus lacustris TaxID=1549641 RepID=A0A4Q9VNA3_9HYPH|nr:type VI secretion system membrane subunit TssM [Siculibacillus lacustris]TBW36593.1 type VI secretion system membrane subunit TssM [Siculibacillus lacustris]